MDFIGIDFNAAENDFRGKEKVITKPGSKVTVLVVPTNEELVIALDTSAIVEKMRKA